MATKSVFVVLVTYRKYFQWIYISSGNSNKKIIKVRYIQYKGTIYNIMISINIQTSQIILDYNCVT